METNIEIKGPQDILLDLPQERLTSITRGRGPRRGNLEDLLRYWRPIMRKPGGFRRCLVILANHPELYPLERICAWLHHETTGLWPNEGNHHKRGPKKGKKKRRRRKLTRSVRRAGRRKKSLDFSEDTVEISAMRLAIRESRDYGGVLVQPIAGRQNVVELKTAMFREYSNPLPVRGQIEIKKIGIVGSSSRTGQAIQAGGSIILPGDISDIRSPIRSQIYETLTPGGGRDRIPSARRLLRSAGRGARNKFRCPPGFQKGGTFTNSEFSTCGAQILGIPTTGPGAPSTGAQRNLARLARNADMVREIGDLRKNRSSYDIIRAAQIPVAPKKGSKTRRQTSVDLVLGRINEEEFGLRAVRRDGVILEPVVSLAALGKMDEFDDLADGTLIDKYKGGQIGKDLIPAFGTGLRDVYIGIPETDGVVRIGRVGGELSPEEIEAVQRVYPTSLRRSADLPDPTASIYDLMESTNGRFEIDFGEIKNNRFSEGTDTQNERIRVQSGKQIIMVPRWVYETFLSRTAPRRSTGDKIFEIVEDEEKTIFNPFAISTKAVAASMVTTKGGSYHDTIEIRAALFAESRKSANFEVKKGGPLLGSAVSVATPGDVSSIRSPGRSAASNLLTPGGGSGRARALFDPNINMHRCPPGTRNAGQFTDQFGRSCGYSLPRRVVNALVDAGIKLENAMDRRKLRRDRERAEGKLTVREKLGVAYREELAKVQETLGNAMKDLAKVLRVTEDKKPGRVGATIQQRRNQAKLTDADKEQLTGNPLAEALQGLKTTLDKQDFENADLPEIKKAYEQVEQAAQLEAGRLTDNPVRTPGQRRMRTKIQDLLADILFRLSDMVRGEEQGSARRRREERTGVPDKPEGTRKPFELLGLRRRVRRVDIPELNNMDEPKRKSVQDAAQTEFDELSVYWAKKLGVPGMNDFKEKEIRTWLRKNKGDDKNVDRLEERRYRDWLELNNLFTAIEKGDVDDNTFADHIGRLAPNRRDNVTKSVAVPKKPDATPDDTPEFNQADIPDLPAAVDTDKPPAPQGLYMSRDQMGNFLASDYPGQVEPKKVNQDMVHEELIDIVVTDNTDMNLKADDIHDRMMKDIKIQLEDPEFYGGGDMGVLFINHGISDTKLDAPPFMIEDHYKNDPDALNDDIKALDHVILGLTRGRYDGKDLDSKEEARRNATLEFAIDKRKQLDGIRKIQTEKKQKELDADKSADLNPGGKPSFEGAESVINDVDLNTPEIDADLEDKMNEDAINDLNSAYPAGKMQTAVKGQTFKETSLDKEGIVDPKVVFGPDFDINDDNNRVGILVLDEATGKVYLRKPKDEFDGYAWTFAKGGIDEDEDVLQAAFREVEEELGISKADLTLKGHLPGSEGQIGYGNGKSNNHFFVATIDSSKVDVNNVDGLDETDEMVLVDIEEAMKKVSESTNANGVARDTEILNDLGIWMDSAEVGLDTHMQTDSNDGKKGMEGYGKIYGQEIFSDDITGSVIQKNPFNTKKTKIVIEEPPTAPKVSEDDGGPMPVSHVKDSFIAPGTSDSAAAMGVVLTKKGQHVQDLKKTEYHEAVDNAAMSLAKEKGLANPKEIPYGGINELLDDDADMELSALSDEQLENAVAAIQAGDSVRFVKQPTSSGINDWVGYPTVMVEDKYTGDVFIIKQPARNDMEHISELSAGVVSKELGIPIGLPKVVGNPYTVGGDELAPDGSPHAGSKITKFGDTTNRIIIIPHSKNDIETGATKLSSSDGTPLHSPNHKQLGAMLAQQYLIGEPDNHSDNRITFTTHSGQQVTFAFDAGKAFMPHDTKYGEEKFGGEFGNFIQALPAEDREEVLKEAQIALDKVDIGKLTNSLRTDADQRLPRSKFTQSGHTGTDEEIARLQEIADFVEARHAARKEAFAKDFPDSVYVAPTGQELRDELGTVPVREFSSVGDSVVKRDADPTDNASYAAGIAEVAVELDVSAEDMEHVRLANGQTLKKALTESSGAKMSSQMLIDGPAVYEGKGEVTDGVMININTPDGEGPSKTKATVINFQLNPEAVDHVKEVALVDADKSYTYKDVDSLSSGHGNQGLLSSLPLSVEGPMDKTFVRNQATTNNYAVGYHGNSWGGQTLVPVNEEYVVTDLGDVKVVIMPDSLNTSGNNRTNLANQVQVFVTGDTRKEMKKLADAGDDEGIQAMFEGIMTNVGIDGRPPSEAQLRENLAKATIRWNTKATIGGAGDDSSFGYEYSKTDAVGQLLSQYEEWGIEPSDLTIKWIDGRPQPAIKEEKAKELAIKMVTNDKNATLEDLPTEGFVHFKVQHSFGGGPIETGSSLHADQSDVRSFVDIIFRDGSFSDGKTRTISGISGGMSTNSDVANGAGDGMYVSTSNSDTGNLANGYFYLFPDVYFADLAKTSKMNDSYGGEHNASTVHFEPEHIYGGGSFSETLMKGGVRWNEGLIKVAHQDMYHEKMEVEVAGMDPSDLNDAANLVVVDPDSGAVRMLVFYQDAEGVTRLGQGPEIGSGTAAKTMSMTGKMPEYKTVEVKSPRDPDFAGKKPLEYTPPPAYPGVG